MSASITVPDGDYVPSEIVSTVFYSATVSDSLALVVAESVGGTQRLTWGNEGATQLLGYGLDDLRSLPVEQLFPSLGGGELKLLLRRERAARMTLPVRSARGEIMESVVMTTPARSGRLWTRRIISTANEHERALRATADAHERRFSALTERSPVPTLLSEQGMRLAHVNDAFCALVGLRAEQLLGTGWINTIHEDDLDGVIEQVAAALDGDEVETQARLVREDGTVRTTVIRFAHLFTPGVGAGFVGTIEDITDRLAFETKLAHQANHDPLTGLPNRTLLAQYVAERFRPGTSGLACLSSTSTTSRSSTTPSATPPATSCSSRSPSACAPRCGPVTWSPASVATSSSSSARTSTRPMPSRWPSASARSCADRCTSAGWTTVPRPASGSRCRPRSTAAPRS